MSISGRKSTKKYLFLQIFIKKNVISLTLRWPYAAIHGFHPEPTLTVPCGYTIDKQHQNNKK